ncbi:deoxypyrimidine-specific 5' nucleotidase type C protein (NT5C) [Sediminihabitans luteus]|uniref:Deoxypyrimidine-specific 5' nucleotidase type C protein (NT5C) n=1 Tax=Sediminihabitans luteus TaxID=1138585 RepID=A0A2M9CD34_9CELL|nr:deoxypyrimidine-specific 5' nucleotidase type C protein (NT5C) [Sediminihabitans luteus]GII98934.1 hypothetical protein Slu03_13120 [Sediminihabitans luteus]
MGFDVDEVLYPWVATLRHHLHTSEGWPLDRMPEPTRYGFGPDWGMADDAEFLAHAVATARAGLLHTYGDPLEGAAEVTHRLVDAGHTVHVVTARRYDESYGVNAVLADSTRRWLERHDIAFTTLDLELDKTAVPTDVYLDDRPDHVDALCAAGTRGVLMDSFHNQDPSCGRERVHSLAEFADLVEEMSANPATC